MRMKNYRYKKIAPLIKGVSGDTRVEGRGIKICPTDKRGSLVSIEYLDTVGGDTARRVQKYMQLRASALSTYREFQ